jgi:hypothetical protein
MLLKAPDINEYAFYLQFAVYAFLIPSHWARVPVC